MKFHLAIEETLLRVVEVEAESEQAAKLAVWQAYDRGDVILDAGDHILTEVNPYQCYPGEPVTRINPKSNQ